MYKGQRLQADPGEILTALKEDIDETLRKWDHNNGGGGTRSNKQAILLAQMLIGREVRDYEEAKGILLHLTAQDYCCPGVVRLMLPS